MSILINTLSNWQNLTLVCVAYNIKKMRRDSELITDKDKKNLILEAKMSTKYSYSPYSNYKVGAALLTKDDKIITGGNVENAVYPLCICAEQVAIAKAVSNGYKDFKALAIYADGENLPYPCGACRQVIYEFSQDIPIIITNGKRIEIVNIKDLLPWAFTLK